MAYIARRNVRRNDEDMEDNDKGPLLIGGISAVLFLAFLFFTHERQKEAPSAPQMTAAVVEPKSLQTPTGIASQTTEEPEAQAPAKTVFECIKGGQRVFSDYPCGEGAATRTLSPVNVMDAPRPIYQTQATRTPTQPSYETAEQRPAARDCTVYENEVKRIDAVMRHGYTSQQGEYLRSSRRSASKARDDCYFENRAGR